MRVFDIGFYDGRDTQYYLKKGFEVIAFEANPILHQAGQKLFADAIDSRQLQLYNLGIGVESGQEVDFFVHTDSDEWSTFYREAAINWGSGKSRAIKVPCITPREMFAQFGCPDYLKSDIEGYDIVVADELRNLGDKPDLVSFEASDINLLRSLLLAGYRSFKLVDQARVPLQSVRDLQTFQEFKFDGGTGPFGDDAEGEWISFENAFYLYFRFVLDPFSSSTPAGHWFDIHASMKLPTLDQFHQRDYLKRQIDGTYHGHCGMRGSPYTPPCPALQSNPRSEYDDRLLLVEKQLNEIHASRAWKLVSWYRRVFSSMRRLSRLR